MTKQYGFRVQIEDKNFAPTRPEEFFVEANTSEEAQGKAMEWVLNKYPTKVEDFGVSIVLQPIGTKGEG